MTKQSAPEAHFDIDELAREQRAAPVRSVDELRAEVWESGAELEDFLTDWRASRDASLSRS